MPKNYFFSVQNKNHTFRQIPLFKKISSIFQVFYFIYSASLSSQRVKSLMYMTCRYHEILTTTTTCLIHLSLLDFAIHIKRHPNHFNL
jgi:hypothetical protein